MAQSSFHLQCFHPTTCTLQVRHPAGAPAMPSSPATSDAMAGRLQSITHDSSELVAAMHARFVASGDAALSMGPLAVPPLLRRRCCSSQAPCGCSSDVPAIPATAALRSRLCRCCSG